MGCFVLFYNVIIYFLLFLENLKLERKNVKAVQKENEKLKNQLERLKKVIIFFS